GRRYVSGSGFACGAPRAVPWDPGWGPGVRGAMSPPGLPAGGFDASGVEPAAQHSVAGVSRSASSIAGHMVDFAPAGWNVAARDEATTVAQGDGLALVRGEAALGRTEFDDAAVGVEADVLGAASAGELFHAGEGDGVVDAVDPADTAAAG